jgi:enoyl-CoA hydratase
MPGGGGSQRLTQAVGKSRAMELILTGRNFSAEEAERWGMVSSIQEDVVGAAVKIAQSIASKSKITVQAAKEAVNAGAIHNFLSFPSPLL